MNYDALLEAVSAAEQIVIVQADNPDGDSLGSALALEEILGAAGKSVALYCAVNMPDYLKYLVGWARVSTMLPSNFDLSIIVDTSTKTLFEKDLVSYQRLSTKPSIIIDHHGTTQNDISFASVVVIDPKVSSTCELVYQIAKELKWEIPAASHDPLMMGILGDTQGLSNQLATASTYRVMSELIEQGANRPALEELRRQSSKMAEPIYRFKAQLIQQTEFSEDGSVAIVEIGQADIHTYSPFYNPGPLIQPEMLQVENVRVGIVFKKYDDGKITAMIRCNNGAEIADKLASHFGGGGHGYAAGFKITDGTAFQDVKSECLEIASELLKKTEENLTV